MEINLLGRQLCIKKEVVIVLAVCAIAVTAIVGYAIQKSGGQIIIEARADGSAGEGTDIKGDSEEEGMKEEQRQGPEETVKKEKEEIKVYVVGCVKNPGIVTMEKGMLINDAVLGAGGFTDKADIENINLVYQLTGNVMLYIKPKAENNKQAVQNGNTGQADTSAAGKGIKIIQDSGGAVVNDNSIQAAEKKININKATIAELDTLPGIGESTARSIIEYREKNGSFKSIKDIMNVPRIKESRFNSIKDFITVD